jgi:hypothetical protein
MKARKRRQRPQEHAPARSDLLSFLSDGPARCVAAASAIELVAERGRRRVNAAELAALAAADLVVQAGDEVSLSEAGRARLARLRATVDPFREQHGDAESPLAWLARRHGRDGRPLIDMAQLAAGERLRRDFTCAGLTPRVTANWIAPVAQDRRGATGEGAAAFADSVIAAKARLAATLDSVGPEFAGLLLDGCCFLKKLEAIELERRWPRRAAKIVLSLALDRLARHYGIAVEARGPIHARTRAWQAPGARPTLDGDQETAA